MVENDNNDLFTLKKTDNKSEFLQKCYYPNIIHYKEIFKEKNDNNSISTINLIIEYSNGGDLHDK